MFADAFPGSEPTIERVTVPSSFLKRDIPMLRVRTVSRAIGEKLCRWLGVSEDGSRSKTKTFEFPKVVTSSREMMQGFLDGYCDGDGYAAGSRGRVIGSHNRRVLAALAEYLQTPLARTGTDDGARIYVSSRWDQAGWYGKHGFRRESEFYVPPGSINSCVARVRRLPPASKTTTVSTFAGR